MNVESSVFQNHWKEKKDEKVEVSFGSIFVFFMSAYVNKWS